MNLRGLSALLVSLTLASDVADCGGSCVPGQDELGETSFVQMKSSVLPAEKRRQQTVPDLSNQDQAVHAAEPAVEAPADLEDLGSKAEDSTTARDEEEDDVAVEDLGKDAIKPQVTPSDFEAVHGLAPAIKEPADFEDFGSKAEDSTSARDEDEDDVAVEELGKDAIKSQVTPSDFEAIGAKADELESSSESEEDDPKTEAPKKGDEKKAAGNGGKSLAGTIATAEKDEFIDREKARSAAFQEWLDVHKEDDKKYIDVQDEIIRHLYDDEGVKKA